MTRSQIAAFTHALAALSGIAGVPIPHAIVRGPASLPGSDWPLVDESVISGTAAAEAERRRADPEFWTA